MLYVLVARGTTGGCLYGRQEWPSARFRISSLPIKSVLTGTTSSRTLLLDNLLSGRYLQPSQEAKHVEAELVPESVYLVEAQKDEKDGIAIGSAQEACSHPRAGRLLSDRSRAEESQSDPGYQAP